MKRKEQDVINENFEVFEDICLAQFTFALDKIQEVAPEDYATIERDEFSAVAYKVFSQGLYAGYNMGAENAVAQLKNNVAVKVRS